MLAQASSLGVLSTHWCWIQLKWDPIAYVVEWKLSWYSTILGLIPKYLYIDTSLASLLKGIAKFAFLNTSVQRDSRQKRMKNKCVNSYKGNLQDKNIVCTVYQRYLTSLFLCRQPEEQHMCRLVIMGDILLMLNWDMSLGHYLLINFSVTEPKINFREESSGPYPIPQIHIL